MTPTPGPPFYGGRQLGALAVNAKARVAQLTGFRSITAAAERLVTFGCFFYRWKARLWVRWGSSCATGDGGRLIAAPTAGTGLGRWFGNGRRRSGTAATVIFHTARPQWGRMEPLTATQILRAGNFLPNLRDNPRNGGSRGWGSWRMRRSRIRLAPSPSAFLVTFWASKKSLAARRRRNPPAKH